MCTEAQHNEKLAVLSRIEKHMHTLIGGRSPLNETKNISDTQGFTLDYKNRKHVYLYSTTPISLDLKSLGILPVPQNTWTLIDFQEGFKLFTVGTTNPVVVFVKATDEVIA